MISSTQNVTAPRHFWEPIRRSVTRGLFGYTPEVGANGRPVAPPKFGPSKGGSNVDGTLPVVTYISRQSTGRRLLTSDHEALVEALRGLEKEGLCTVRKPIMENLNLKQQLAEIASSTVSAQFPYTGVFIDIHLHVVDYCGCARKWLDPPDLHAAVFEVGRHRDSDSRE